MFAFRLVMFGHFELRKMVVRFRTILYCWIGFFQFVSAAAAAGLLVPLGVIFCTLHSAKPGNASVSCADRQTCMCVCFQACI